MKGFTLAAVILVALSCAPPAKPPAENIQNIDLGLTLSGLPPTLELTSNQGASLELRPTDTSRGGVMWFSVGPEKEGVNLVAAVKAHQAQMEGEPNGDYQGAQELQGDFGSAFYSRARYTDEGHPVEETVVFMIHPSGNRLLAIHYRYPAGDDSAVRVEELINVIGYIEMPQAQ